ncbi:hypothetical protein LOK49_LG14G01151 [Camellia lanceoleosa]|uniref:Uncharacterized protein n=1 Tax=Camellia lanceoleosa TaxID=1840588 RepID=A0ACC0FBR4_9ERIC|nr:hypothetical protein LOK49_LG14G01151 [Camellia lanceoleosa]
MTISQRLYSSSMAVTSSPSHPPHTTTTTTTTVFTIFVPFLDDDDMRCEGFKFAGFMVWGLVTGRLLQTRAFPLPITAIVVDPTDKKLFSGSVDGTIFLNTLDFGVVEDTSIVLEDEPTLLTGHKKSNDPICRDTGETTAAMEMMVETSLEGEAWATRMGKHLMEMNKHLQTRYDAMSTIAATFQC